MRRIAAVIAVLAGALMLGSGVATADSWPVDPGNGSADRPVDLTDYVLTPNQPGFWNPAMGRPRVISPYGTSTKIVCMGYVLYDACWQADSKGNPHKLDKVFSMGTFGSLTPTPPQNVFVYPGMFPGS